MRSNREYQETVADYDSKTVMLRAERGDQIHIDGHGEMTVVERKQTYYGPQLILDDDEQNWMLTAPGPASDLQLWTPNYTEESETWRRGWVQHSEVSAELGDLKQYDLCPVCGDPLKSAEHEWMSKMGVCDVKESVEVNE